MILDWQLKWFHLLAATSQQPTPLQLSMNLRQCYYNAKHKITWIRILMIREWNAVDGWSKSQLHYAVRLAKFSKPVQILFKIVIIYLKRLLFLVRRDTFSWNFKSMRVHANNAFFKKQWTKSGWIHNVLSDSRTAGEKSSNETCAT